MRTSKAIELSGVVDEQHRLIVPKMGKLPPRKTKLVVFLRITHIEQVTFCKK